MKIRFVKADIVDIMSLMSQNMIEFKQAYECWF